MPPKSSTATMSRNNQAGARNTAASVAGKMIRAVRMRIFSKGWLPQADFLRACSPVKPKRRSLAR